MAAENNVFLNNLRTNGQIFKIPTAYVRRSEKIDEMSGNEFSCKLRECKLFCLYFFIAKPALKNHKKSTNLSIGKIEKMSD